VPQPEKTRDKPTGKQNIINIIGLKSGGVLIYLPGVLPLVLAIASEGLKSIEGS
jgi:hypothetical protein